MICKIHLHLHSSEIFISLIFFSLGCSRGRESHHLANSRSHLVVTPVKTRALTHKHTRWKFARGRERASSRRAVLCSASLACGLAD